MKTEFIKRSIKDLNAELVTTSSKVTTDDNQDTLSNLDNINILDDLEIEESNRSILKGQEIDIYIPDLKVGVEVNGDYWHSDEFLKASKNITAKEYHENKLNLAKEQEIELLFIWESDWLSENYDCKSLLKEVLESIIKAEDFVLPSIFLKTSNSNY